MIQTCHLLFLKIFHHSVNACLCGNMGAVDQTVGSGVEIFTTVECQRIEFKEELRNP